MLTHLPLHRLHQILVTVEKVHLFSIHASVLWHCWSRDNRDNKDIPVTHPAIRPFAEYTTETKKPMRTEGDWSRL